MTWVYLDDDMPWHPKIASLTPAEFALHVESICYCGRYLTDGVLPENGAKTLRFWTEKRRDSLVKAGVWDVQTSGRLVVHDYDQHQRSRAQVQAEKAANRERQERWRQRHSNAVTNGVGDALVTTPYNLTLPNTPLTPQTGGTESAPKQTRAQRQALAAAQKRQGAVQRCRFLWRQGLEEDHEPPDALRESLEREYRHDPSIVTEAIGAA